MITEMQRKMGGWIVELVAPALIMLMTGSLAFFLVEVFYYGASHGRVKWVLTLFVFASVLTSRISIMEGFARAIFFGLVLGAATLLVLNVLTEVSFLLSLVFIGTIWWFNSKLTWDCTVIDQTKDSTDRGLLARFGFDSDKLDSEQESDEPAEAAHGTTDHEAKKSNESWTKRLFSRKKAPNTPGVWVLILSLAAFPIFGIGQGFISDEVRRQNAFFDFCLYLIGGLGLLVTTAMIGLQRYLQKRNATMPNAVAVTWVASGVIMIGVILFSAWMLPRPYSEYSFAENPFKLTKQSSWQSSRNAVGSEGKDDGNDGNQDNSSKNKSGSGKSNEKGGKKGSKSGKQGKGKSGKNQSGNPSKSGSKQSSQKNSTQKSSSNPKSGKSKSGSSKSQKAAQKGNSSTEKSGSKNRSEQNSKSKNPTEPEGQGDQKSKADKSKTNESKTDESNSGKSKSRESNKNNSDDPKSNNQNNQNGGKNQNQDSKDKKSNEPNKESNNSKKQNSDNDNRNKSQSGNSSNSSKQQENSGNRSGSSGSSQQNSSMKMPSLANVAWIVQLLFWIALAVVLIILAIKYRKQIWESFLKFLEDLKNFWANLFGKKRDRKEKPAQEQVANPRSRPKRPFATYSNPFANEDASNLTMADLVHYSFEALEAWGRERGCPRSEDQTPHEFALNLVQLDKSVARRAKKLADFYCTIAFANNLLDEKSVRNELSELWRLMQQSAASDPVLQPA